MLQNFISQVVEFNEGQKALGVDDQLPVLCYCLTKIKMNKFLSNLKFIQLYKNSLSEKGNENNLIQLYVASNLIMDIKPKNLYGITP